MNVLLTLIAVRKIVQILLDRIHAVVEAATGWHLIDVLVTVCELPASGVCDIAIICTVML